MKVLYELDLNDIIRIVSEKYGVPQEKVKKTNKDGLNYLMIDMSTTETPEPVPFKDYVSSFLAVSPFLAGKKAPAPEKKEPEKEEPEPTDEELQELKNKLITSWEQKAILKSLKKAQAKRTEPGIDGNITIYTCPVCGKEFDIEKYPQYAYKKQVFNHKHIFCGYDCMRKAEKALNP